MVPLPSCVCGGECGLMLEAARSVNIVKVRFGV